MVGRRIALLGVLAALVPSATAHAAFPGANGKILFHRSDYPDSQNETWTTNPDGSHVTRLFTDNFYPAWSPDGQSWPM